MSFFIIFLSSSTIISFQFSSWQFPFLSTILSYHLINVVSFLISFNSVKFLYFLLVYFHCSVPSWKYYIYSLGYECMYTRPPPPSLPLKYNMKELRTSINTNIHWLYCEACWECMHGHECLVGLYWCLYLILIVWTMPVGGEP